MSSAAASLAEPRPGEVYLRRDVIAERVAELGAAISRDHRGCDLVLITVLKGAAVFLADLSRAITVPHRLEFMAISAYSGASAGSMGRIRLLKDLDQPIRGAHVVIVEDVIDTGLTLHSLLKALRFRAPASIEVCTLLDRPLPAAGGDARAVLGVHCPRRVRGGIRLRLPAALQGAFRHPRAGYLNRRESAWFNGAGHH